MTGTEMSLSRAETANGSRELMMLYLGKGGAHVRVPGGGGRQARNPDNTHGGDWGLGVT